MIDFFPSHSPILPLSPTLLPTHPPFHPLFQSPGATSRSRASETSTASSSISILSKLSLSSAHTQATTGTGFSIGGLDHTLLSRGEARGPGGTDLQQYQKRGKEGKKEHTTLRKQKRKNRQQARGEGGRDVWGIKNEAKGR